MSRPGRRLAVAVAVALMLAALAGSVVGVPGFRQSGGDLSPLSADNQTAQSGLVQPTDANKASPVLLLPSEPAVQWGELSFSAEGFQAGETVRLQVDAGSTMKDVGQAEADGEGKITNAKLQLPSWLESGKHSALALGASSGATASGTLLVRARELWINLSSYTPRQAGKLGFIAGGFQPGERVRAYLTESGDLSGVSSDAPLAAVGTDEVGNTPWTELDLPVVPPGRYVLLLVGDRSKQELKTAITVSPLSPELELSPWSGPPGRRVKLNCKGYLPGEEVDLLMGGDARPVLTVQADQFGGIWGAGPVTVPARTSGGALVFTLRGRQSGAEVTATFTVVAPNPWVELSSYSGFAGTAVMAHGGGFASGEKVTLHVGSVSAPAAAEAVTNEEGYYQGLGPALVPADAEGEVVFVVVGEGSGAQGQAVFKVMEPFLPETPRQNRP